MRSVIPQLHRLFSTASSLRNVASPLADAVSTQVKGQTKIIPKLTTFYSANPQHESNIDSLENLLRANINLPSNPQTARPTWLSFDEYALIGGGTRLKPVQYEALISLLNRLHSIDSQLTNDSVLNELQKYYKKSSFSQQIKPQKQLDEFGRSEAVGRRKTSSAKVYLTKGEGKVLVNGRGLADYFTKLKDRESLMYPLKVVDGIGKYNVFVLVSGGGVTGQAEAAMHAIGKSLVVFNPLLKGRLRNAGMLTRDYRHVERKKAGHKKARKMPTWVKR